MTRGFIEHHSHARTWFHILDIADPGSYADRHRAALEKLAMDYMRLAVEIEIKTRKISKLMGTGKVD